MKNVMITLSFILIASLGFGQNQNEQTTTKTTVKTVKNAVGEKKIIEKEVVEKVQEIKFEETKKNNLNKDLKNTPVEVTSTTQISVDGVVKSIEIDHTAYYNTI